MDNALLRVEVDEIDRKQYPERVNASRGNYPNALIGFETEPANETP
jgi:hypothetical protein